MDRLTDLQGALIGRTRAGKVSDVVQVVAEGVQQGASVFDVRGPGRRDGGLNVEAEGVKVGRDAGVVGLLGLAGQGAGEGGQDVGGSGLETGVFGQERVDEGIGRRERGIGAGRGR